MANETTVTVKVGSDVGGAVRGFRSLQSEGVSMVGGFQRMGDTIASSYMRLQRLPAFSETAMGSMINRLTDSAQIVRFFTAGLEGLQMVIAQGVLPGLASIMPLASPIFGIGQAIISAWQPVKGFIGGFFGLLGAAFGGFVNRLKAFPGNLMKLPSAIAAFAGAARASFVRLATEIGFRTAQVGAFLGRMAVSAFQAGKGFVQSFARGVGSFTQVAVSKVAALARRVRAYLPFSPAKVGALSDIDQSGAKLVETVASTITPDPLVNSLNLALSQLNLSVPTQSQSLNNLGAIAPRTSFSGTGQGVGGAGVGGNTIYVNQEIHLSGDGQRSADEFLDMIRRTAYDIRQILSQDSNTWNRAHF